MDARRKPAGGIYFKLSWLFVWSGCFLTGVNAAELKKIKYATLAGTTQPVFFVAQDKGFLAEEGIDVDIEMSPPEPA